VQYHKVCYIVEADIKGFFDNVDHEWLIKFLEHDIADKNFIEIIKKFLKAGIMEDGNYIDSEQGTPQGNGALSGGNFCKGWYCSRLSSVT